MYGRADLVFDHWLYPVFESVHGAEPRSCWLRSALDGRLGPIRHHNLQRPADRRARRAADQPRVCPRFEVASLYVWEQVRVATVQRASRFAVRGAMTSAELAVEIERASD